MLITLSCIVWRIKVVWKQKKIDLNVENRRGETPLHLAASGGNLEVIKYVVETKKFNFNVKTYQNSGYNTPLNYAAQEGHLKVVKYFINDKKADINVKNSNNETPLHLAAFNDNLQIVKYLIND